MRLAFYNHLITNQSELIFLFFRFKSKEKPKQSYNSATQQGKLDRLNQ